MRLIVRLIFPLIFLRLSKPPTWHGLAVSFSNNFKQEMIYGEESLFLLNDQSSIFQNCSKIYY